MVAPARVTMPVGTARDELPVSDPGSPVGRRRGSRAGLGLRLLLAAAAITTLSLAARTRREVPAVAKIEAPFVPSVAARPASPPLPPARFGTAEPGLEPVRVVAARIDPRTGAREDTLTRGAFDTLEVPALRVTLTRGANGRAPSGLFVLMARRAANGPAIDGPALAVVRTGPSGRIDTKFGSVDILEVTLAGPARRTCTGFATHDTPFQLDGWLCAPLGQAPDPRSLACAIDALSLVDLADADATAAFSAAPDPERSCQTGPPPAEGPSRTGSIGRGRRSKK